MAHNPSFTSVELFTGAGDLSGRSTSRRLSVWTCLRPARHVSTMHEAARIQTFPDWFVLKGAWDEAMRQIGNAVPVSLGTASRSLCERAWSKRRW